MGLRDRVSSVETEIHNTNIDVKYKANRWDVDPLARKVKTLEEQLQFQICKHDELKEQFDMLMGHLGLRIENGPRIVKDK